MANRNAYLKTVLETPSHPGQISVVTVRHDHDCPRLRGGACTCQAFVEQMNRSERRSQRKRRNGQK